MEDESFITFEFNNFNWFIHADTCKDCGALLKSMQDYTNTWYLFMNGRFRLIDFLFGEKEDWTTGHLSYSERSYNFVENSYYDSSFGVTRLRLKLLPCDPHLLRKELIDARDVENYKRCEYFNRTLNSN